MRHQNPIRQICQSQGNFCSFAVYVVVFVFFYLQPRTGYSQVAADFTTDTTNGCVPFTVHCTSTQNEGVTSWYWTAGNGQTSTAQNPTFTFTRPGKYRIKLKTSDNSSADSVSRDVFANGIYSGFTYQYNTICTVPVAVNFTSHDTSADGNYHWDFGDSAVSIARNPAHTYRSQGRYMVRLTTYSKEGCIDSTVKIIETGKVAVDFTSPDTACSNSTVTFTSTSSSVPKSARWTINGEVVNRSVNGFPYTFTTPGTYTIQLTEDFGGCSFGKEKKIVILRKPTALFNQSGTLQNCLYPSVVQFSNASSDADTYIWDFGDGSPASSEPNPIHRYETAGQFSPALIAANANGCSDIITKPNLILLGPPIITGLQGLPASHCLPYAIHPMAIVNTPEPIAAYDWNFGNGDHAYDSSPAYTYRQQGYYDVTLILKTVSGCTDTFFVERAVSVGDSVVPDFTVDKTIACGSDVFTFTATASAKPASWSWRFGDGTTGGGQTISHRFLTTGSQTVSVDAANYGCRVRKEKKDLLIVKPPIAGIAVQYDCTNQLQVKYKDATQGALSWQWDFGDGSPVSSEQNPPLHVYSSSGIYKVKLSTGNEACKSTDSVTVSVLNTKPVFTYNPANGYVCRKQGIEMAATNPEYIADYYWNFDDGKSAFSNTFIVKQYDKAGVYHPSLVARYKNGCYDTLYSPEPVHVTGPTASFDAGDGINCLNNDVVFKDKSVTDDAHKIVSWWWNCGDAYSEIRTTSPFSHTYAKSGSYAASLLVKDNNNCTDTAYFTVKISALPKVNAGNDTFVCEGSKVQLQAGGALSYVWNKDNTLNCVSCGSPVASPLKEARYVVTGTDGNNCSASDTVLVQVVRPFNLSVTAQSSGICQTKSTRLTATGTDLYSWQPAAGLDDASAASPLASPDVTTQYFVTGTDKHHCFSQRGEITVNVYPRPQVNISDSFIIAEKGDVNLLQTTGSDNIASWLWSPPAGLSCNDCPQPLSTANKTITYTAVVYTDHGCSDTDKITIQVLCNQNKIFIPTGFTPNHDGTNDFFFVKSSTDNPIRSFSIYSRNGERIFLKTNTVTNNPAQGWDGTYKSIPISGGVYIYRIEILCNDEVIPFTGTITLLR